jgi:hypothetical protein
LGATEVSETIGRLSDASADQLISHGLACRIPDGMAANVDRIRALGNGQVPAVAAIAWQILSGSFYL